jgi:hypothetical protein
MPNSRKPKAAEPGRTNQSPPVSPRKAYRRPELSFYGDVSQVTRGNVSNMSGDAGGAATKMCWIADELYGVAAPRTVLVRAWLNDAYARRRGWALVAVPLYRRFGVRVARRLRSSTLLESMLRPLFDHAVRCAHRKYAAYVAGPLRTSINPSA